MDQRLKQDALMEDALKSQPLAPMPCSLTTDVMERIQAQPLPRFRIATSDYLLSIVLALVLGAILFGFQTLPPYTLAKIQIQAILLWQSFLVNYRWLLPLGSILLGTCLAGIMLYQLLRFERRF
jgi:hypothetical protein